MSGRVYLLAGAGPGTGPRSFRYQKEIVRATGKDKPVYAYVGAASGDARWFEQIVKTMVFGSRAKSVFVRLTEKKTKTSSAKAMLDDADVIFVSGGDVEEGMRVIEERGLSSYFRELSHGGKILEGVSAGSIMLGKHWVRFEHDGDHHGEVFDCLGVVPISFDAHDEKDGWGELHALARLLPAERGSWVCGLTSKCAGLWDGERLVALGGALARFSCGPSAKRLSDLSP